MNVHVRTAHSHRDRKIFARVPWRTNAGDPSFVPPLLFDVMERLSPRKNPFFEHGEAALFLCERDGEVVGRISAQINTLHNLRYQDHTGFFGFFDAVDDPEVVAALTGRAEEWLLERGMDRCRGPFSFSINDDCGVLVDGFDAPPYLLMAHNPPYYGPRLEEVGYRKAKDLLAWRTTTEDSPRPIVTRFADAAAAVPGVVVRKIRPGRLVEDVRAVMDVFNDAWSENWGFVPMTERELAKMAKELKLVLDPEIALVAELDGRPVAIAIALPNVNEAIADLDGRLLPFGIFKLLWRLKVRRPRTIRLVLLGIRQECRGTALGGLVSLLFMEISRRGRARGYQEAELSWTLEDNRGINKGIQMMGGVLYKRYRIYEKAIGAEEKLAEAVRAPAEAT